MPTPPSLTPPPPPLCQVETIGDAYMGSLGSATAERRLPRCPTSHACPSTPGGNQKYSRSDTYRRRKYSSGSAFIQVSLGMERPIFIHVNLGMEKTVFIQVSGGMEKTVFTQGEWRDGKNDLHSGAWWDGKNGLHSGEWWDGKNGLHSGEWRDGKKRSSFR